MAIFNSFCVCLPEGKATLGMLQSHKNLRWINSHPDFVAACRCVFWGLVLIAQLLGKHWVNVWKTKL